MITLTYLLRMLQPYTISSNVEGNTDFYMDSVSLLAEQDCLCSNHVYIGKLEDVDQFISGQKIVQRQSLLIIIESSQKANSTQAEIPNGWILKLQGQYRTLCNYIMELFQESQKLTMNLLQFNEQNYDIQNILDILARLGNAQTLLLGSERQVLYTSAGGPDWMSTACDETIQFIKSRHMSRYFIRHLNCGIRVHGYPLTEMGKNYAYLLFLCKKTEDADYMYLLDFTANIIKRHLHNSALHTKDNAFEQLLDDLFKGRLDTTSDYAIYDRLNHLPEKHKQYLIPATIIFNNTAGIPYDYIISQVKAMFTPCSSCIYKGNIMFLFSSASPYSFSQKREALDKLLNPYPCKMAFSTGCYSPSKLVEAYTLAKTTAELSFRLSIHACPYTNTFSVDDYRPYIIVDYAVKFHKRSNPEYNIAGLCCREVYLIAIADHYKGTDYLEVLFAYLATNRSLTRTAELLHMHKNSVTYKLGKIKTIIGSDIPYGKLQSDFIESYYICKYAEAFYDNVFQTNIPSLEWIDELDEPFHVSNDAKNDK